MIKRREHAPGAFHMCAYVAEPFLQLPLPTFPYIYPWGPGRIFFGGIVSALYRHFKGRYYQVIGTARDTATESDVVVYRTLYPCDITLFTRPADEFYGQVALPDGRLVERFAPVSVRDVPDDARSLIISSLSLA